MIHLFYPKTWLVREANQKVEAINQKSCEAGFCPKGKRREARNDIYSSSKSSLVTPQSGHIQVSGTSSHEVPGSMPSSGQPSASSYIKPQTTQIYFLKLVVMFHHQITDGADIWSS